VKTADVMTQGVVSVLPTASIAEAARLMLSNGISGLPVIDKTGALVGMVTEGDFLRRAELGTEKHRPGWLEFLLGANRSASEYVLTHARKVGDVMTRPVVVAEEDTPLDEVVHIMETNHIKRLPVMRGSRVVGVISRANLLHALAALQPTNSVTATDASIRARLLAEIDTHLSGAGRNNIVVKDGVVDLWGTIIVDRQRDAIRVAAENIPGVKQVRDHLAWIEPYSGTLVEAPDAGTPINHGS